MSKRTERREAERLARKLAYKQLRQQQAQGAQPSNTNPSDEAPANAPGMDDLNTEDVNHLLAKAQAFFHATPDTEHISEPTAEPESTSEQSATESEPQPKPLSDAQRNANRANAQHSTGPTTSAGRARSALNALKHGLTGQTVVLPYEDADEYQLVLASYIDDCKPATEEEHRLVQSMVDCGWRLSRLQRLETSILMKGHLEFAKHFQDRSPIERAHLINAEAYLKYERQLRNLNIQEARLLRTREKDRATLTQLQATRRQNERAAALQAQKSKPPSENGFEFATPSPAPAPKQNPATQHRKQAA